MKLHGWQGLPTPIPCQARDRLNEAFGLVERQTSLLVVVGNGRTQRCGLCGSEEDRESFQRYWMGWLID